MTTGVQFDEDNSFRSRTILGQPVMPKMVDFLVRNGFVKDYNKAKNILLVVTVMFFILSLLILYFGLKKPSVENIGSDVTVGYPIK